MGFCYHCRSYTCSEKLKTVSAVPPLVSPPITQIPNHRAGFYKPHIYIAFLLIYQQRKLTLYRRFSGANNKQSAKTCKDNRLDSSTQSEWQGRSHTGNYKGPSPAGSRLQQRGKKAKLFVSPSSSSSMHGAEGK